MAEQQLFLLSVSLPCFTFRTRIVVLPDLYILDCLSIPLCATPRFQTTAITRSQPHSGLKAYTNRHGYASVALIRPTCACVKPRSLLSM